MAGPRYYCPPGVAAPAHLPPLPRLNLLRGPDDQAGVLFGHQPYVAGEPGWQRTAAGWWHHLAGVRPRDFRSLAALPGPTITHAGEPWQLAQVIMPEAAGWRSAIERVRTAAGYEIPEPYGTLGARLARYLDDMATTAPEPGAAPTAEAEALAVDLLRLNYPYLAMDELIALRWLTEGFVLRLLMAGAGRGDGSDG